jgi:hypothetical protein
MQLIAKTTQPEYESIAAIVKHCKGTIKELVIIEKDSEYLSIRPLFTELQLKVIIALMLSLTLFRASLLRVVMSLMKK